MITIHSFTFNPFQENTYILSDETKECILIDPGCYEASEKKMLSAYIESEKLKPVKLINTHAHIDHILGNNYAAGKYNLKLEMHKLDVPILKAASSYGSMWGILAEPSPEPDILLDEGDVVKFGHSSLNVLFTPGHSAGSISFHSPADDFVIAGDVLFYGSIGRTDLPGGDFETLIRSINEKLFPLGDTCNVYPGHGPETTVGFERQNNPFLT